LQVELTVQKDGDLCAFSLESSIIRDVVIPEDEAIVKASVWHSGRLTGMATGQNQAKLLRQALAENVVDFGTAVTAAASMHDKPLTMEEFNQLANGGTHPRVKR